MDEFEHSDLLKLRTGDPGERTPFCPDDRDIAAWFDAVLADDRRAVLERHLADCPYCRARIGVLGHLDTSSESTPASGEMLAAAKRLGQRAPARRAAAIGRWASAAVLVLAIALVFRILPPTETDSGVLPPIDPVDGSRQLRSIDQDAMRLEVLIDDPVDAVGRGSTVRWSEVRGSVHYTVHVLSADGDVLLSERTGTPEWAFAEGPDLAVGESYFLRIEAVLPDGGTVNSRHIHFRAAGR